MRKRIGERVKGKLIQCLTAKKKEGLEMNKLLCILFVTNMLLLGGCSYKSDNVADKDKTSIQLQDTDRKTDEKDTDRKTEEKDIDRKIDEKDTDRKTDEKDTDRKMDEKEIEQLILSWFQNNHYMYKATNQYVCDCSITDKLYGKKAHFPILSDKNKFGSLLYFAFIDETGEIYLFYTYNKYIPVNRVKILEDSKYEKKAIAVMKEKFGKKKARKMAYCDTIERDGIKYFVYGEFESSDLQLVYLLDIKTGEIYNWDLPEDELNRYINS